MAKNSKRIAKPSWLRAKLPAGPQYSEVRNIVDQNQLHTVCQSAQCPNMGECWSRGTATLMILGNIVQEPVAFVLLKLVNQLNSISQNLHESMPLLKWDGIVCLLLLQG